MRETTVVLIVTLLASCSGAGGVGAPPSPEESSSSRVDVSPATDPTQSGHPIDLTSLSGRIVFDNFQDVWSINADGSGLRRLTSSPWPEFDPSLSPDGRFIAYRSEPHNYPELWVMRADGTRQHRLTRDGGFPTWSPDGSMIAYAPAGGPSGRSWIAIMNADGSGMRRLPHTAYGEYPSWSPNGRRIAFSDNLAGEGRISIVDTDGPGVLDLSDVGEAGQVAWSSDGRSILFASERDHSDYYKDVYVMRPNGSGIRRLTHVRAESPAWSPDGRYIVFASPGGLGVMRADGSGVTYLPIEGVGQATFPDWS
jgi:TolB protein